MDQAAIWLYLSFVFQLVTSYGQSTQNKGPTNSQATCIWAPTNFQKSDPYKFSFFACPFCNQQFMQQN